MGLNEKGAHGVVVGPSRGGGVHDDEAGEARRSKDGDEEKETLQENLKRRKDGEERDSLGAKMEASFAIMEAKILQLQGKTEKSHWEFPAKSHTKTPTKNHGETYAKSHEETFAKSYEETSKSYEETPKSLRETLKSERETLKSLKEIVKSNGEMLKSNGEMLKSNGEMLKSNGEMLKSNGEILNSNGEILKSLVANAELGFKTRKRIILEKARWKLVKTVQKRRKGCTWVEYVGSLSQAERLKSGASDSLLELMGSGMQGWNTNIHKEEPIWEMAHAVNQVDPLEPKAKKIWQNLFSYVYDGKHPEDVVFILG